MQMALARREPSDPRPDPIDIGWAAYEAGDDAGALRSWYFDAALIGDVLAPEAARELGLRTDKQAIEAFEIISPLIGVLAHRQPRPQVVDDIADDLVRQIADRYADLLRNWYDLDPGAPDLIEQAIADLERELWNACAETGSTYAATVRRTLPAWDASRHWALSVYLTPEQLRSRVLELLLEDIDETPPPAPEVSPAKAASVVLARWLRPGDALNARHVQSRVDEHLPRDDPDGLWEFLATVTHPDGTGHEARGLTIADARLQLATVLGSTWLADELSEHGWRVDRGGNCPSEGDACRAIVAEPGGDDGRPWLIDPDVVSDGPPSQPDWLKQHASWHVGGPVRLVSLPLSGPEDWHRVVVALDENAIPMIEIEAVVDDDGAYMERTAVAFDEAIAYMAHCQQCGREFGTEDDIAYLDPITFEEAADPDDSVPLHVDCIPAYGGMLPDGPLAP